MDSKHLTDLIAELAKNPNFMLYPAPLRCAYLKLFSLFLLFSQLLLNSVIQYLLSIDSVDKQRIVIRRSFEEAELFDQKPSSLNEQFWELLLCRGGSILDKIFVVVDKEGCCAQSVAAVDAYRWYPRSLLKTLLLVSTVLRS